jgi:PAS domain S-box-containing protein
MMDADQSMIDGDRVNILLVDDQPGKLLSYEAILGPLGENLITARSGREALECLLKTEIAVILLDVNMPELDGFELAAMIREHPRYRKIAMIFISAIHLSDIDRLRGYEMGAVDYVPVPVVPEVLRAKVKIFAELYRKTRQLEQLNAELEQRVHERTAALEAQTRRLMESEQRRSLALAAAQMGSWHWDSVSDAYHWDAGLYRIFGVDPASFKPSTVNIRPLLHAEDWPKLDEVMRKLLDGVGETHHVEFRIHRPDGKVRWCIGSAASTLNEPTGATQISGVILDISERKADEDRQALLAREVDHRAKNALALVQALVRLTRAQSMEEFVGAVEGRILSLSRVHSILSQSRWEGADLASLVRDELAPFDLGNRSRIVTEGPDVLLDSATAQTLALVLHELATNTAKYGALSLPSGRLEVMWRVEGHNLMLGWKEHGGPAVSPPTRHGFGTSAIIAGIKQQQGGDVSFDWKSEGLDCRLRVPLKQTFGDREVRKPKPVVEPVAMRERNGATPAVMIVEDEVLVALDLQESVRSLGYEVVGPYARLADAIEGAETQAVDFAILDLNLNGEMTYELAESLQLRGIPIVFTTGYETEDVKARLRNSRVLNKPVVRDALENVLKEHFDPPLQRAVAGR